MEIRYIKTKHDLIYAGSDGELYTTYYPGFTKKKAKIKGNRKVITIRVNGSKNYISVAKEIAIAFIPNPLKYRYANTISDDAMDTTIENIEWYSNNGMDYKSFAEKKKGMFYASYLDKIYGDYKKIFGVKDLYICDNGWMYTTDCWGVYEKLPRSMRKYHYFTYFKGVSYQISSLIHNYFIGAIPTNKRVSYKKGKNPKKSNLILVKVGSPIVDNVGEVSKSGWEVIERLGDTNKVIIKCPCKDFIKEITYRNFKIQDRTKCPCKKMTYTKKIDASLFKKINLDFGNGMSRIKIGEKYNVSSVTVENVLKNKYNYDEK